MSGERRCPWGDENEIFEQFSKSDLENGFADFLEAKHGADIEAILEDGAQIGSRQYSVEFSVVELLHFDLALGTLLQPVILYGLPWDPNWAPAYGFVFFLQGLVCSWCFAATNRPIFSELVPPASRASLLSRAVAVEGASASIFGAPVVGLLAEKVFGYTPRRGEVGALGEAVEARNAAALAHARWPLGAAGRLGDGGGANARRDYPRGGASVCALDRRGPERRANRALDELGLWEQR